MTCVQTWFGEMFLRVEESPVFRDDLIERFQRVQEVSRMICVQG